MPESRAGWPSARQLAREWTSALSSTAYVPISRKEIESLLQDLAMTLLGVLAADRFSTAPAVGVGERLVWTGFTGGKSLSRTVEVLGSTLPAEPELRGRVIALLGAVAAGYTAALQTRILDQQETVKLALLKACQHVQGALRVSETTFRKLFTASAAGIAISDLDGRLLEVNQALGEIVGQPPAELIGRSLYELFHPDETDQLGTTYRQLVDAQLNHFRLPHQLRLLDRDGETVWTYLAVSLLHDAAGEPTRHVTMLHDVTELHLLGDRLSHQSLHDALTGLPNQQFFISSLEAAVGRPNQAPAITLCKIDLDGLAVVNDGLGRCIGDRLLTSVAGRLQSVVAEEKATVARFGSDEFAIMIEHPAGSPDVAALATSINDALAEPVYVDGNGLASSACIGIVTHKGGSAEPAELLRAAEATLRRIKSNGKRQWALFDPHRDADERASRRLAATMPGAWEHGEIDLTFQPLVRLVDGAVVGVEAQLRWEHPQQGPIPHRQCLKLAAETGLVLPLGEWLLSKACEWFASSHLGSLPGRLHVDLTSQQANDPDLVSTVRRSLADTAAVAEQLQLGIPAPALAGEPGETEDNLRVLAGMGITIALLEFGGAADLGHVEDLRVSAVEVARRMVSQVAWSAGDSMVSAAITGLLPILRSRGVSVIVRDIQTQEQATWWQLAGADVGQGDFLARSTRPTRPVEACRLESPTDHEG